MQEYRLTFKIHNSYSTPFQSDTIFGHICWAIRFLESEESLAEFLSLFDSNTPPLLISDAFPALIDEKVFYIPKPVTYTECKIREHLSIGDDDKARQVKLSAAWKRFDKKAWIDENIIRDHSSSFDLCAIFRDFFDLKYCPMSMRKNQDSVRCESWKECPALVETTKSCSNKYVSSTTQPVTHNVINRLMCSSENLYMEDESFPSNGFHMLIKIDENHFDLERLQRCMDFVASNGFGKNASTGKGALVDLLFEPITSDTPNNANWFINLSSSYVPREKEIDEAYYSTHVKRGKIGPYYTALGYSPWKKPILMIKSGSVIKGDPSAIHGSLLKNVHNELTEIRQYGFAYPLGVKIDA